MNTFGLDDIPGAPDNDDDQDYLVEGISSCPCIFIIDSTNVRSVCSQQANLVFDASYSGDSIPDDEGPLQHSFFPHELDAHNFAVSNTP